MRVRLLKGIFQRLRSAAGLLMLGLLMALANPQLGVSEEIAYYSHRRGRVELVCPHHQHEWLGAK